MMLLNLGGIKAAAPSGRRAPRGPTCRVPLRAAATVLAVVILGGCGFQLEGTGALPTAMARTYLETSEPYTEFFGSLREALRARGSEVVANAQDAGAVLTIVEDTTGQRVLSVSARNIPREYEVYYSVTFSVTAGPEQLLGPESIVVTRSYTYDETQVLGKALEERTLRRALAQDLARQVLRRIEAAGTSSTVPHS
jgi:LPS-assembly lipoprotein